MEVVLHHVSDIHIGEDHFDPKIQSTGERRDPSRAFRFRSYVEWLERSGERLPDLVVLSGDFVSKGEQTEEFETAHELIERLVTAVNRGRAFDPRRVCLVPGNHDLNWKVATYEEKIENFRKVFGRLDGKAVVCEVSERPYFVIPNTNIFVYLLNSCPLGGKIRAGFVRIEAALKASGVDEKSIENVIHLLRTEQRVDPGYVDGPDLKKMIDRARDHAGHLKIAVMHHNLSSSPSEFIDQFSAIINAGEVREHLRDGGFDLVLHGHQHHPYCTYEQVIEQIAAGDPRKKLDWPTHRLAQGIHILGAPSLGTSYADTTGARWFRIKIASDDRAKSGLPSSLVEVEAAEPRPAPIFQLHPVYRFSLSKPLSAKLGVLHEHLDRTEPPTEAGECEVRESVVDVLLPILKLKGRLDDWETEVGDLSWQNLFLDDLDSYETIFGTDLLGPVGWMHANYLEYIHKQFEQKRRRRAGDGTASIHLRDAMNQTEWGDAAQRKRVARGVQIARILLWDDAQINDEFGRCVLSMVDLMHRLHDVPVFVLNPSAPGLGDEDRRDEFVFVSSSKAANLNCYVYDTSNPNENTKRLRGAQAAAYLDRFNKLLGQPELKSIKQILS